MLFTNRIVTIRERGRGDSVTLDCVRSDKLLIERMTKANEIMLERFGNDFKMFDCKSMLAHINTTLFDNYLLLGNYKKIQELDNIYSVNYISYKPKSTKIRLLNIIRHTYTGSLYRVFLQNYLFIKYKIFNYKIK